MLLLVEASHRSDVLESVPLCLSTFHSFGHKVSCQVKLHNNVS